MAKKAYIGINDKARQVKKIYVGADNVARKVKKAFVGVANVARLWWQPKIPISVAYDTFTDYTLKVTIRYLNEVGGTFTEGDYVTDFPCDVKYYIFRKSYGEGDDWLIEDWFANKTVYQSGTMGLYSSNGAYYYQSRNLNLSSSYNYHAIVCPDRDSPYYNDYEIYQPSE